ncbi:DUF721 domain-containing protein [Patescibacteria group bacterium]|nr:DUF721 domain-containing protein [Patescibacteria group bacterium]
MAWQKLENLLPKSIKKAGVDSQVGVAVICDDFIKVLSDVFDERVTKKVKPMYIKNKTLTIAVMNSVLAQEIKLHEPEILKKMNKHGEEKIIERLRFLV